MRNLKLGTGITVGSGGLSALIASALTYTRGTPDVLKVFLTDARGGAVGDALTLALTLDGVDVSGDLDDAASAPQLASTTAPAGSSWSGGVVSALESAPVEGDLYLLEYEIAEGADFTNVFTGAGSPWESPLALPKKIGINRVLLTCETAAQTTAALRATGTGTFTAVSVRKAQWEYQVSSATVGDVLAYTITNGDLTSARSTDVPDPDFLFVANTGSDIFGSGSATFPYKTPGFAQSNLTTGAGVTMRMAPGTYPPFEVSLSGTVGNTFDIDSFDGQPRTAIIEGTLQQHEAYGGPGVLAGAASEDGIRIWAKNYVRVLGVEVRNVARHGIYLRGGEAATQYTGHTISGNKIHQTGACGIFAVGSPFGDDIIPAAETGEQRLADPVIETNNVSATNVPTDFNTEGDSTGRPGGTQECITVGGGVQGPIVRNNYIHDSLQYGIDVKSGSKGAQVYGNTIHGMEKYGIYIDAGLRFCNDTAIYNNTIWDCRNGIVWSREGGASASGVSLNGLDIYNNIVFDTGRIGLYGQLHPGDDDTAGTYAGVQVRFNTLYNADREGGFVDIRLDALSVMSGCDFTGNLIYSDAAIDVTDEWTADAGATVADNFNFTDGTGTDPLFVAPDTGVVIGSGHIPTFTLPNFNLQEGSPAKDIVDEAGSIDAPFNLGPTDNPRTLPADAGAGEVDIILVTASAVTNTTVITPDGTGDISITPTPDPWGNDPYVMTSADVASIETQPHALNAGVLSAVAGVNDTITYTPAFWAVDDDGPAATFSWDWYANAVLIAGETDNLTLDTAGAGYATPITVVETITQTGYTSETATSNAITIVSGALVFDDFDYANNTILSGLSQYTAFDTGDDTVVIALDGEAATNNTTGGRVILIHSEVLDNDQFCELDMGTDTSQNARAFGYVRFTDADNHYGFDITFDEVSIFELDAGVNTRLSDRYPFAVGDVVRLEAEGTTLRLYVNGALQETLTNSSQTSGEAGFGMEQSTAGRIIWIDSMTIGDL